VDREWLARRIETEAWAYANADHLTRDLCLGRMHGFLEVGVDTGYWSKKVADQVADSIQQKWGLRRVRRRLVG
jgi:hypothetical protein